MIIFEVSKVWLYLIYVKLNQFVIYIYGKIINRNK
jgi:hypothetical protein